MNKRKIIISDMSDEDDSFKHRRSSLRVNLSYTTNLTDSGNGSLYRTKIENVDRRMNKVQADRSLRRSEEYEEQNNSQFEFDKKDLQAVKNMDKRAAAMNNDSEKSLAVTKGIHQLKHLSIHLQDISSKERTLETNCKRLKDAILNKTKEIFDGKNELFIKTAMVLGNEKNCSTSSTHNSNSKNKSVLILDTTDHCLRDKAAVEHEQYTNQQKEDRHSNITATPINKNEQSSKRATDKCRLTPRQLFATNNKQPEGQAKCRIIEDIVLQQNQNGSPILSGSNRLKLLKARSKLRLQNQSENHDNTFSETIHSFQSIDMRIPCSTFIEDNATAEEKKRSICNKASTDTETSRATHTTNKIISMEMTEIHGGIRMSEEQSRNPDANNCIENKREEKSKERNLRQDENATMQRLKDINSPLNKLTVQSNVAYFDFFSANVANDQGAASICVDTVMPVQASIEEVAVSTEMNDTLRAHESDNKRKNQSEKQRTLFLSSSTSSNTTRSSLNVNTSLDAMVEVNEVTHARNKSRHCKVTDRRFGATITNNEASIVLDDQRESTHTAQTSLQMNTSVDSMRKTKLGSNHLSEQSLVQDKNDKNPIGNYSHIDNQCLPTMGNKEADDVDFLENISLIERLRNISTRNQLSHNIKSRVSEMRDKKETKIMESNVINVKCSKSNECTNNSSDSYSCVEGTPYPISRSIFLKSLLRRKTQNINYNAASCSDNLNSLDSEEKNDTTKSDALHLEIPNDMPVVPETQKTAEADTVTLRSTLSCSLFPTQNQSATIEETYNEARFKTGEKNAADAQNVESIPIKKNRRKLLSFNENSQLYSFTPVEENKCTAEESTPRKRNKKLKKKRPKRKSAAIKNNINNNKHNITSEQVWADNDCDTFVNIEKKNKKTRKPRKVISKKIIIKKFVDENVLNILKSRQNKRDQSTEDKDSLDDFVKHCAPSVQRNKYKSRRIVIVTTGLSKEDKSLVRSIVKSLGTAEMELNVSKRTTHVVNTGVRTVNLLRGIIRGCWLVTLEWVLQSLENNGWLNPEKFEMKHFSKAVEENRKDRQLFGPSYIPELFATCGFMYVEHKTTVPCDTLKELIKTAGGHITENIKLAKIIIGANGLKETWVIDSITTGELQLTKPYQRE